jgi:hypothetical protein
VAPRANLGIGIPIALFFLIGGVVFWILIPDIFIGQIWVGVSLLLLLIFGALSRAGAKAARIRREGIQGTATVLGMEQTGVYINEQPQVRLKLRVEAQGLEPYEVEKNEVVPMIALPSLGAGVLPVAVDRADRGNVEIDWSAAAGPMTFSTEHGRTISVPPNHPARQEVLAVLRRHGLALSGQLDLRQHPAARSEALGVLARHGFDAGAGVAATPPGAAPGGTERTSVERLLDLKRLLDEGAITQEEHDQKRAQILAEL